MVTKGRHTVSLAGTIYFARHRRIRRRIQYAIAWAAIVLAATIVAVCLAIMLGLILPAGEGQLGALGELPAGLSTRLVPCGSRWT